jgi:hypothetical protein
MILITTLPPNMNLSDDQSAHRTGRSNTEKGLMSMINPRKENKCLSKLAITLPFLAHFFPPK